MLEQSSHKVPRIPLCQCQKPVASANASSQCQGIPLKEI